MGDFPREAANNCVCMCVFELEVKVSNVLEKKLILPHYDAFPSIYISKDICFHFTLHCSSIS